MVSRYIGSSDIGSAQGCAKQSLIFAVVFGLILTPAMVVAIDPILSVIGSPDINGLSSEYMMPICCSISLFILNGTMAGLLRGEGAARLATYMVAITAVVNVVLDPVLIYVLDMGISGAAYATVIATGMSTLFGAMLYASRRTFIRINPRSIRPNRSQLHTILQVGAPQMLEYAVMYAMNIVLNYLVLYCAGSYGLTIYSVPNVVLSFAAMPAMAIGSALVPVASSAYGQRDMARMRSAYDYSLKLSVSIVVAICIVMFVFPEQFLYIFTYSPETEVLRGEMAEALRICCLYIPFFAMIPIGSSLPQALTMPNRSVVLAIIRNLVLIALYAVAAQHELYWIFWAVVIGEAIGGIMMFLVAGRGFRKMEKSVIPS